VNLILGLVLLGGSGLFVWSAVVDPEGGPLGGLRSAMAGEPIGKRVSETAGAFIASTLVTGSGAAGSTAGGIATTAANVSGARAKVLAVSETWLGTPYAWGGNTKAGVDCSGLTRAVFATVGVQLPRVSAAQALTGRRISAAQAQPGDLVAIGAPVHHVGIYLGNGMMRHAPHSGTVVRDERIWGGEPVYYRDVIGQPAPHKARRRHKVPAGTVAT
jgi:peptidoglycan DL-endopeptidase CwlO